MNPTGPANPISRRYFNRGLVCATASMLTSRHTIRPDDKASQVAIARGPDRLSAIEAVIESLGGIDCQGKDVFLKASFNSPHPFPATTHPQTLERVIRILRKSNCAGMAIVERSGMGTTREIWRSLGIIELAKRLDVRLISLDELPTGDWRREELPGSHWKKGVEVPPFLTPNHMWIQLCNLKTHRFGGHFSASLKNSIGLVAKYSDSKPRYNYMSELHSSADQRLMIAEVNQLYAPVLVLMDATEMFIDGGPETGEIAAPGVIAASRDRVALDAAGLALLRLHSPGPVFSHTPVFEDEQVKRAAELGLGAKSAGEVQIRSANDASGNLAIQIKGILSQAPSESKR